MPVYTHGKEGKTVTEFAKQFNQKKRELFARYYGFLNPPQQEAVATVNGPLLVLAGAGSGKTTVLVNRIGNIILFGNAWQSEELPYDAEELYPQMLEAEQGSRAGIRSVLEQMAVEPARPWRVLCITFTNKAAGEFKERLQTLLGERARDIWAGTFHSVCVRILRRHIGLLGYPTNFTIYDTDDVKKVVTAIMKRRHMDEKILSPKAVMGLISRYKDKSYTPEEMMMDAGKDTRILKSAEVYAEYQRELKQSGALDFDDIIMLTETLFREHPAVLEQYRNQFDYVLVDEFQDTNPSQNRLVAMLGGGKENVCVVGDDDQSIYSFRGATVENILQFDHTFPKAKIIRLEQNYRSTGHILNAANAVIKHNQGRKGKNLWTKAGEGECIHVHRPMTQGEEALAIIGEIRKQVNAGKRKYGDFAVLYRLTALSNNIEQMFVKHRIPYRICGGLRFNERREIKDVLSYLSVVNNPADNVRLRRIINVPKRAIGDTTLLKLETIAGREGMSLFDVAANADCYSEMGKASAKLKEFARLIESMREFGEVHSLTATVEYVLQASGYMRFLAEEAKADGDTEHEREQNVKEFLSTVKMFEETAEEPTLAAFLEEMALVSDLDELEEGQDAVTMMTIHSAKGLEFPVVFLIGFEDGLFPSMQALMEGGVEEERRLAYVAITRAKEALYIYHCESRMLYGRTDLRTASRFLAEIPEEDCERSYRTVPSRREMSREETRRETITFAQPRQPAGGQITFAPGDRVKHPFFGAGEILSAQNMGGDMLYEITFDNGSTKRIMGSFAKLQKE
ncbi:MAG: UvrD-helicase domain-containing protein [Clostridia bacterium]|nr:UvrD-helicase domain-containing protein [Clostridia bacterium]